MKLNDMLALKLIAAVVNESLCRVKSLLDYGADPFRLVSYDGEKVHAMNIALKRNKHLVPDPQVRTELIRLFLAHPQCSHGINALAPYTALQTLCHCMPDVSLLKSFLQCGANPNMSTGRYRGVQDFPPLFYLARQNSLSQTIAACELLLNHGAKISFVSHDGQQLTRYSSALYLMGHFCNEGQPKDSLMFQALLHHPKTTMQDKFLALLCYRESLAAGLPTEAQESSGHYHKALQNGIDCIHDALNANELVIYSRNYTLVSLKEFLFNEFYLPDAAHVCMLL